MLSFLYFFGKKMQRELSARKRNIPFEYLFGYREKRASYVTCRVNAGLTLEASLTFPLFLAAIVAFLFFIQVIRIQIRFQTALYNQSMKTTVYGFYLDDSDRSAEAEQMISAVSIRNGVVRELGEDFFQKSNITNGSKGVKIEFNQDADKGNIDVVLSYRVAVPFNLFMLKELKMTVKSSFHTWVGNKYAEKSDKTENMVYITAGGEVYHTKRDCTYIYTKIEECVYQDNLKLTNSRGNVLVSCKICKFDIKTGKVYYTKYGERMHWNPTCPSLINNVYMVEECVAKEKYRLCSKCGGSR